jgi:cobalamin biosynthesis Mg chelatase CobN
MTAAPALLPVVARAESSGEVVYHEGVAGLESIGPGQLGNFEPKAKSKAGNRTKAHGYDRPTNGEGGSGEPASEPEGESESEGTHKARVAPAGKGGKHPPGGKHAPSKALVGPGPKSRVNVSSRGEVATPKRVEAAGNAGGSSPIVPILIAMAVLAALSVGVVLYRERRGDDGADGLDPPA